MAFYHNYNTFTQTNKSSKTKEGLIHLTNNGICKINGKKEVLAQISEAENKIIATIKKEDLPTDACFLDFCPEFLTSGKDSDGYAIAPRGTKEGGTMLCRFTNKPDCEYISDSNQMPIFGFKTADRSVFAIVTGMTFEYKIVVGVKAGIYYIFPRFYLNAKNLYEDMTVEYYLLPKGSDYNDMAALYRSIKNPIPLKMRAEKSDEIKYAADALELRIRMAWKPVPAPVLHQTPENEPEVIVGCTCKRAMEILDAMKAQGVEKAEVCLVGIEAKGHDGRWPQLLPIEETIGGQADLEALCQYGQSLGYQMTVHTNSTEMYEISNDWDENQLIVNADGQYSTDGIPWGGGLPYHLCSQCTQAYTSRNLNLVRDMGFRGVHYIDVLSNFPPRNCYSTIHPSTARESAKAINEIAAKTRDMFGGFASEGAFDFMSDDIDYVLYTSYNLYGKQPEICDETIPFWQLVFHGSILYNPSTETVNYGIKETKSRLKFIEYGGRPVGYINSKYVDDVEGSCGNWMGNIDLLCATDEQLALSVKTLKELSDEYEALRHLQFELMLKHEKLADGVYAVTYSDNTVITVDYNKNTYEVTKA